MDSTSLPKISILTPSFNQADFISQTVESIRSQGYPNYEHIVIDGGSTDGTVDYLKEQSDITWVSEKDEGQADALNKGIRMATGDIIGWLNSDDYYMPGTFEEVANTFSNPDCHWLIGAIHVFFDDTGRIKMPVTPKVNYASLLKNPDLVSQPPTFYRKSALEEAGYWNKELFMVMDYDLWLRLAKSHEPHQTKTVFASFRIHAGQKSTAVNFDRQNNEILQLWKKHGVALPLRWARFWTRSGKFQFFKIWRWVKQR